jgi:hypothetical protein
MSGEPKQYVGKGKIIGKFGDIKLGLKDLPQPNERGYINLIVSKMREPDKNGNEYTVYVNSYQPAQSQEQQQGDAW